jgi:hypothetical protein
MRNFIDELLERFLEWSWKRKADKLFRRKK